MNPAQRRSDLVYLVVVYDNWRARNRPAQQWTEERLRNGMTRVGSEWTGRLDIAWFTAELTKVRALPGEYPSGSYERWRRHGLPAWAALAAGIRPTTTDWLRHRRAWWRLWRYCRCGLRWPCPDSIEHVPMPYQPPPVLPLTRREYRAAVRANSHVELTEQERAEIRALTPDAPPPASWSRPTNDRAGWDAGSQPYLTNGRPNTFRQGRKHRAGCGQRV
ncbi:hypothetical protein [Plantactinospora sp. B5E13]|uniref:hypothetical protein n=1 Tax=unclassified Plantactinospora TaxID=2631981 RepID=UPI00325D9853